MVSLQQFLKAHVFGRMPAPARAWIKRLYYPRMLRRFSEDRWPAAAVVRRLVKPGDCVVDVGANIGYVTMLLSRMVGESGAVVSIEPVPETFRLLQSNVRKLGLANVHLFNCAASAREGRAVMEIPRYPAGGENLYEAQISASGSSASGLRTVTVDLCSLDSILAHRLDRVAFVKIDVEEHEWEAVQGAGGLVTRSHPAFMIEISGRTTRGAEEAGDLFAHLADAGYSAYTASAGRLVPRQAGDDSVDCFFLTADHCRMLTNVPPPQSASGTNR